MVKENCGSFFLGGFFVIFRGSQLWFTNCFEILLKWERTPKETAFQPPQQHYMCFRSLSVILVDKDNSAWCFSHSSLNATSLYPTPRSHCIPSNFVRFRNLAQFHSNIFRILLFQDYIVHYIFFRYKVIPNCSTVLKVESLEFQKYFMCLRWSPLIHFADSDFNQCNQGWYP